MRDDELLVDMVTPDGASGLEVYEEGLPAWIRRELARAVTAVRAARHRRGRPTPAAPVVVDELDAFGDVELLCARELPPSPSGPGPRPWPRTDWSR